MEEGCLEAASSGFLQHPADGRSQSRERIRSQNHGEQKVSAVDNRLVNISTIPNKNGSNREATTFGRTRTVNEIENGLVYVEVCHSSNALPLNIRKYPTDMLDSGLIVQFRH